MAGDELRWGRLHAHEANVVGYGHFSAESYGDNEHGWSFLREPDSNASGFDTGQRTNHVRVLDDKVICGPTTGLTSSALGAKSSSRLQFLEASAAKWNSSNTDYPRLDLTHCGETVIATNGAYHKLSRNARGVVLVFVSGCGQDELRTISFERSTVTCHHADGDTSQLEVPTVCKDSILAWKSPFGRILQVARPYGKPGGKVTSILGVRSTAATHLLAAISTETATFASPAYKVVITLPISVTGGHLHADCALKSGNSTKIAIVDIQGNWSVWNVHGRNTHTAKVSYTVHLKSSGKLFSWYDKKRPQNIGPYFDGWHKIVWTSSNGSEVDRVLVCNRQIIKIFDLGGREVARLDPRIGYKNSRGFILDVKVIEISLIAVLTTSKVLVFDTSRTDWKDWNRLSSVAMVCAFSHGHNPQNLALRITLAGRRSESLLMLYTENGVAPSIRRLRIQRRDGSLSITASDPVQVPDLPVSKPITSITIMPLEVQVMQSENDDTLQLYSMIVSFEDASIHAITVDFGIPSTSTSHDEWQSQTLPLPPKASTNRMKSSIYVNDEDDLLDFVEPDEHKHFVHESSALDLSTGQGGTFSKSLNKSAMASVYHFLAGDASKGHSVDYVLRQILDLLDAISTERHEFTAGALIELSSDDTRAENIDEDSVLIEEVSAQLATRYSNFFQIMKNPQYASSSLLDVYEALFTTYIESLPSGVPGRTRFDRERLLRKIALEQVLASHIIVPMLSSEPNNASHPPSEHPQISTDHQNKAIHSDPLHFSPDKLASSREPRVSATQAQAENFHLSPLSNTTQNSALQSAISRLSAYSSITVPPDLRQAQSRTAMSSVNAILAHLPTSSDSRPEDYDYNSIEFEQSLVHHNQNASAKDREVERRRAQKIARAKERAMQRQRVVDERSTIPNIGTVLGLPGARVPTPSGLDASRHVLPIRGAQSSQGGAASTDEPRSSQGVPGISMTQPEAGAFGQRKGQHKAKKSKRRAGF